MREITRQMFHIFDEPPATEVHRLLQAMVGRRVAVVGDSMLDIYLRGSVSRISPEAPVSVFEIGSREHLLGGAANVAKCLVALGADVKLVTCIGNDLDGDIFLDEVRGLGIDALGVLRIANRPTTTKTRVVAQQQQMLRLDEEVTQPLSGENEDKLANASREAAEWAEAVVLSDYAKGMLTSRICRSSIDGAGLVPTIVDPKALPLDRFRGATILKPNLKEACAFLGPEADSEKNVSSIAHALLQHVDIEHILLTLGAQGMALASRKMEGLPICLDNQIINFKARSLEVFDVTGAGDVVAATLALALSSGADVPTAAWFSNVAAGIKIGKFGSATVSAQEILETLGTDFPGFERKIMTPAEVTAFAQDQHRRGQRIVFTNGCFDILHLGHVTYLERARQLGDCLILGMNSDASVRRVKGLGRPVQSEYDRVRILAAQACVDAVVLFSEDTPQGLIQAIHPDVLCKGGNYVSEQDVVGWDIVQAYGGAVEIITPVHECSTSDIISRM